MTMGCDGQNMKKVAISIILFAIIFFSIIISIAHPNNFGKNPLAEKGVIDLSHWDFAQDGLLKLNGEWELYEKQLLTPEDFTNNSGQKPHLTGFIKPTAAKKMGQNTIEPQGIRTYRLIVQTSGETQYLGVKADNIMSSSKLYINGELLGTSGNPAAKDQGYEPYMLGYNAYFKNESSQIEILLQTANFDHPDYSLLYNILLGTQKNIEFQTSITIAIELCGAVLCFLFALYHLLLFYNMKRNVSAFYFALNFFAISILFFFSGEYLILRLFPQITFDVHQTVFRLAWMITSMTIVLYFNQFDKKVISNKVLRFYIPVAGLSFLYILITSVEVSGRFMGYISCFNTLFLIYMLWRLLVLYLKTLPKSVMRANLLLHILCLSCLCVSFINNLLYSYGIVSNKGIGSIAIAIFILMSQVFLALRFTQNYDKMLRMDKVKDEFIIKTSYELQGPLYSIADLSESVMKEAGDSIYQKDRVIQQSNMANQIALKLIDIVNSTLDVILLRNHELKVNTSPIDMKICTELVLESAKKYIRNSKIAISADIEDELLVEADESRVRQILMNLLLNAIKSMEQGSIHIQAKRIGRMVTVSIEDTGCGISSEHWLDIFKPYVSLRSQGIGLGLYVTRLLVELMEGQMYLEWSEINKGSRFVFTLPSSQEMINSLQIQSSVIDSRYEVAATNWMDNSETNKQRSTILVVDDEMFNIQTAYSIFKETDYELLCVHSSEEALNLIEEYKIDLIILDVMMPGSSGMTLCKKIREKYSIIEMPILLSTVSNAEYDLELGLQAGANDIIRKPFVEKEVIARVKSLIGLKVSMENTVKSELAFLHAQIQPHFIFNAINTMISFCYTDSLKAAKLLVDFSRYLRLTFDFDHTHMSIPISRELEMIHVYMEIEKARFGDKYSIHYDIDEQLLGLEIPPLCIQPLVENAIKHGLNQTDEGGDVYISIKMKDDSLMITVRDTGVGMTNEMIEQLTHADNKSAGVGFSNILKRIRWLKNAHMEISSTLGEGTKVILSFEIAE